MFIDDRDVEPKGQQLSGKTVDFIVTGGIASIESPRLIRELRRYGANVRVVMTPNATQFVSPLTFEWASKNKVVTELSGTAEHITSADVVLIAPATLDFISRMALGLADSAAATLVQSALNRLPVLFAPSMHLSLTQNPVYQHHLKNLTAIGGVELIPAEESEGKAKMAWIETIAARVCHYVSRSSLKDIPIVISLGSTRSYADDLRYFSNRSSGALGIAIATELYCRGAKVTAICGPTDFPIPSYLNSRSVETNDQMREAFHAAIDLERPHAAIFCAAVLDFAISKKQEGKISSKGMWNLELQPTPKLIQSVAAKDLLKIGFKLESKISVEALKDAARESAKQNNCEFVVANRFEDIKDGQHKAWILNSRTQEFLEASTKKEIAQKLAELLETRIQPKI
jgi:phosphopantothenoylcysteine decarboxylase/phosphopantothenate--cysteine ligase